MGNKFKTVMEMGKATLQDKIYVCTYFQLKPLPGNIEQSSQTAVSKCINSKYEQTKPKIIIIVIMVQRYFLKTKGVEDVRTQYM